MKKEGEATKKTKTTRAIAAMTTTGREDMIGQRNFPKRFLSFSRLDLHRRLTSYLFGVHRESALEQRRATLLCRLAEDSPKSAVGENRCCMSNAAKDRNCATRVDRQEHAHAGEHIDFEFYSKKIPLRKPTVTRSKAA